MTLWFVLALMTAAAIFAVLWPLARREKDIHSGSDIAVYRDQLDEVRRDRAAGLIGEAEAAAAEVEVSRRLLAAASFDAVGLQPSATAEVGRRRRLVSIAALALLPVCALGLYTAIGSPLLPGQPLASRIPGERPTIEQMIAQVEARLAKNPQDGRGWEVIAPIYLRLGRYDDAVRARRLALKLIGDSSDRYAGLGEALTAAANGVVTAEALAAFRTAVTLDAENIKARFYLGLAAEQDGRVGDAIKIWLALIEEAPPDAPWVDLVRRELRRVKAGADAGGPESRGAIPEGPTEEQIAAAKKLAPEQRIAMIRAMVQQLADRLGKDGTDLDGWLRLMRSYMVLGERERAIAAAGNARRIFAADPDKLRRIEELVKGLGLDG